MLADPVDPVPKFVEVTAEVTLFWAPAAAAVTVIENVHAELFMTVAPDNAIELPDTVTVPPHWLLVELAAVRPEGR